MRPLLLLLLLVPFCSRGQDTQMPFNPQGDSVIAFEKPVKTWYVQTLEELHPDPEIKKSSDSAWVVLSYEGRDRYNNPEDQFFIAHKKKYSWRIMQIELEQDAGVDTVYFTEVDGGTTAREMVIGWSRADGVSGEDFSWNERVEGILVFNCLNDAILLNSITYYEENHYGSSVNENMLAIKGSGFDSLGRNITNTSDQHAIEMLYKRKITFDKTGSMAISLIAFDSFNKNKAVKTWPLVKYIFTPEGWKKGE